MAIIMFVDRRNEFEALRGRLTSDEFELIVIYGRRRVGKTRLVLESIRDLKHLYFLATETGNIRHFKAEMKGEVPNLEHTSDDWEAIFHQIKGRTVVIDEFPNLIIEDPTVVSQFQKIVDTHLKDTKNKLILLGSSISMMTDRVLSYKSPLYGRRTSSMELEPLRFRYLGDFFPGIGWEEMCRIFAVTDGIPYYIEKVRPPMWEWLEEELKRPDSFMRQEVDFLLKYEFTDSRTYRRFLEAIANGNHTPVEIRNYTGMKHSDITPYLRNLMDVKMVVREIPVTEGERSRKGRYFIADNLLTFWFRFILPSRSSIQEGLFTVDMIKDDFNRYMGKVFERIAREFIIDLNNNTDKLSFRLGRIGRWWHREEEIDIVGLDQKKKRAILFEVKWKDLKKGDVKRILGELERKSTLMGLDGYQFEFGIVARKSTYKEKYVFDLRDFDMMRFASTPSPKG